MKWANRNRSVRQLLLQMAVTLILVFPFAATAQNGTSVSEPPNGVRIFGDEEEERLSLFHGLAASGDSEAMFYLGKLHQNDWISSSDPNEAVTWLTMAADLNHLEAQLVLSGMYGMGWGPLNKNDEKSLEYGLKAAEGGNVEAQFYIGSLLLGRFANSEIKPDYRRGAILLKRAANQGHLESMEIVGAAHYMGKGAAKSYTEAYYWLGLASMNGSKSAAEMLPGLEHQLERQELKDLESRLLVWKPNTEIGETNDVDEGSASSSGSGFLLGVDGYAVTNEHVVRNCKLLNVNGNNAYIVEASQDFDLALLKVESHQTEFRGWSWNTQPELAENILVAGFPLRGILASDVQVTAGVVSALRGPGNSDKLIQVTAPIQPGSSGGPVVDGNGALVGVVVSKLDTNYLLDEIGEIPQNVNFAIPVGLLQYWLSSKGRESLIKPSEAGSLSAVDQLKKASVAVECFS